MERNDLVGMAEAYFAAVDAKDLERTLAFLHAGATFTIASHGLTYRGRETEIRAMFERLFARYDRIWHGGFDHVVEPPSRIACRFGVLNTSAAGEAWRKNNCNFFRVRGPRFDEVVVYMSGDNALG